ncbi:complement factor I-like isoform X2 [Clupea harengus]|uniref:trypsin n=1 Tax=Clupea harengus TaxID=7950 RepID=A0A6P8GSS2_CLUHA|nr:complement factor I-like isoform X2 [Clupea harengus]
MCVHVCVCVCVCVCVYVSVSVFSDTKTSMKLQTGALLLVLLIQKTHLTYSYGLHAPGLEINGHPSTSISDINLNPNPHLNPNPNLNPSTNLHLVPDYSTHRHPRSAPESIPDAPTPIVLVDNYLGPEECVRRKYTHLSCKKAFCPSWMRCENGTCVCKMSFECPRHSGRGVCGLNGWRYSSHCEALADSCLTGSATFSHFGDTCSADNVFSTSLKTDKQVVEVFLPNISKNALVCAKDWDMAAANVVCRDKSGRGVITAASVSLSEVQTVDAGLPSMCVRMQCTGHEYSLAECNIYGHMKPLTPNDHVASVQCGTDDADSTCEFKCANGRCVKLDNTCDGINHCGDGSDEMCCKACRRYGSHCQSNVCIPFHAVGDGIRDCLGGEDDLIKMNFPTEIKALRDSLEVLECGVPNPSAGDSQVMKRRRKRIVGGVPTEPTQIQWQVAIQEKGQIQCGGAYLGGCWVLTAAHCISRAEPEGYVLKFSQWRRRSAQPTTDVAALEQVFIHPGYNRSTHSNDIALLRLKRLGGRTECLSSRNPAVRPVCVPWSTHQFQPGHVCTISGWGRREYGRLPDVLQWANVALLDNCQSYHTEGFHQGMMCAGDVDGRVDSCQGDTGGPLVCKDPSGVSYVWGVVGHRNRCGERGSPGLYTQVAHYYDWIRTITENAVAKYNQ